MTKNSDNLRRAADAVGAVEMADGRWAYYAEETQRYYVMSAADLEDLCGYLDDEDEQVSGDAYGHWCAGTDDEEMPAGWEP